MMTEKQLFTLILATINAGLVVRTIAGVKTAQEYQPNFIGAPGGMALMFSKINIHPYGFPKVEDKWEWITPPGPPPAIGAHGRMAHTETQIYEATIQCTGYVKQPPPDPRGGDNLLPYTAGDLCKVAGRILQSSAGLAQLKAGGCGVERIMQIPQAYFTDDSDRFAQSPHFDFILTYIDTETTEVGFIAENDFAIVRV